MSRYIEEGALLRGRYPEVRNAYQLGWNDTLETSCERAECIHMMPARYGYWVNHAGKYDRGLALTCSECGKRASSFVGGTEDWWDHWAPDYCPHCGAKMEEEVTE